MGESPWDSPGRFIHECHSSSNLDGAVPSSPLSAPGKLITLPMTPKTSNSKSPSEDLKLPTLKNDRNVNGIPSHITASTTVDDSVNSSLISYDSQDDPNVLAHNSSNDVKFGSQTDQSQSFSDIVSDSDEDEKSHTFQKEQEKDEEDDLDCSDDSSDGSSQGIVDQTSTDYEDDVWKHEISFDSHSTIEQQGEEYTINDLEEVLFKNGSESRDKKDDDGNNNIDELRVVLFQNEGEGEEHDGLSLVKANEGNKQLTDNDDDDDWSEDLLQPIIEDDESVTGIVLEHLWGSLEPPKKPVQHEAAKMKHAIKKEDESLYGVVLDHLWGCLEPPKKLLLDDRNNTEHAKLKPTTLFLLEEGPHDSEDCDRDVDNKNLSVDESQDDLSDLKQEKNNQSEPEIRPTSPLGEASLLDEVEAVDEDSAVPVAEDASPSPPRGRQFEKQREDPQVAESPKYTSFREVRHDESNDDLLWMCGCDGVDTAQLLKGEDFEALPYNDSDSTASSTTFSPESPSSAKGGDQTLSTCGESSIEEEDSELDVSCTASNSTPKKKNTELAHRHHHQAYVRRLV